MSTDTAGAATGAMTAGETAAAKIRRVLPKHLERRLESVLEALSFTTPPGEAAAPDTGILLSIADAVHHRRPVSIRYVDRDDHRSERTLHPYGIVAHNGRWYTIGTDPAAGEDRTLRLDRVIDARVLPGSFEEPAGGDPAQRILAGFATAPYRYEVTLHIQGTVEQIRARLPASVARVQEPASDESWLRVELRVERLDWLPPVLAALDRPFIIEQPEELRDLVTALAERLSTSALRR